MALEDSIIIVALAVVAGIALAACVALIVLMRRRTKKPVSAKPSKETEVDQLLLPPASSSPFRVSKSVQSNDAVHAKDELRILDLEREILGDAIRRLYEAHAEGKITETEREKLAGSYKQRMMSVKDAMARDESIVAIHELESMQEDLMKLFSERFGELSGKVDELRTRIDIKPIKEIKIQMPKPQPAVVPDQIEEDEEKESAEEESEEKEKPKKPKKPATERPKTEAEQRIDAIRSQIDEVMNKLGQMEMEG
jgi:hypothetical protein